MTPSLGSNTALMYLYIGNSGMLPYKVYPSFKFMKHTLKVEYQLKIYSQANRDSKAKVFSVKF
jgi:hypothetical protein